MPEPVSQYDAYMRSDTWQALSDFVKRIHGHRCQICNRDSLPVHTHHRTYKRLSHELIEDLTVLCEECHARFHSEFEYNSETHEFVRKVRNETEI